MDAAKMALSSNSAASLTERISHELYLMRPLIPTYIHLIISAIFPIYIASHASLSRPSSAATPSKTTSTRSDDDEDEDEAEEPSSKIETLRPSDAILFPIMAGCTLASLYFILKFLKDPAWLNWFLGIYFAVVGSFFMFSFLKDSFSILQSFFLPKQYSSAGKVWKAIDSKQRYLAVTTKQNSEPSSEPEQVRDSPFPGFFSRVPLLNGFKRFVWNVRKIVYTKAQLEFSVRKLIRFKCSVEAFDLLSVGLTVLLVSYHTFIDKPWYLTNLLGFSFCYGSLQFITPGTSWTGSLFLAALFFYDIYFVFFTPMMVTVATKLDVPIKLLFPRPDGCILPIGAEEGSEAMEEYLQCIAKKRTMAMLGLGDIVIPGIMLAFALRFDLYLFYLNKSQPGQQKDKAKPTDKPKYVAATGSWGERFWTTKALYSENLRGKGFPKVYFHATVTGYIIGMLTTVMVMQIAQHAQPALLYLVPGVLISLWGTALARGDFKKLWEYSEIPEAEEDGGKDRKTNDNKIEDSAKEKKTELVTKTENSNVIKKAMEEETRLEKVDVEKDNKSPPSSLGPRGHLVYFSIIVHDLDKGTERSSSTMEKLIEGSSSKTKDQI